MGRMLTLLMAMALFWTATASAESIRDLVKVQNTPAIALEGVGIVTGLANSGDRSEAALQLLREYLSYRNFDFDASALSTGSIALVRINSEFPPFLRPGQKFAVTVTTFSDARSLEGGELMFGDLFSADGELMARASGQIQTGPGILTRGAIPAGTNSGAMSLAAYSFGKVMNDEGWIRLNLNKNSYADATNIARRINQTPALNPYLQEQGMFEENEDIRPVAFARDAGQVVVIVPEQYRYDLSRYIAGILDVEVSIEQPPRIIVNRARNTIVVTGDIRVNNAVVSLQDMMVTVRPDAPEGPAYVLEDATPRRLVEIEGPGSYADIQGLIDTMNAMGLSTDQVITIFEQLRYSGAIIAELEVQ